GYVFSDPATANGNAANALEMVKSAQAMVISAAFKMDSALAALNAALAELAAIGPPQPGPDGKVDPAAQQAYEAKKRAAEAKVSRANQDVLKANYEYRTSVEALDRANMMLPVAQERDDAERRAFEESRRLVQERQRQIDDAMRQALEASREVEKMHPNTYWAWDTIRTVARDVNQGDMRLGQYLDGKRERMEIKTLEQQRAAAAQSLAVFGPSAPATASDRFSAPRPTGRPLTVAPAPTGLASNDDAKPSIDSKGKAVESLLRTGRMNAASARAQDWKPLGRAANADAIVGLLRIQLANAAPTDQNTWQSAIDDMEGRRVGGNVAA
ncbi:MAG TPA: hypothetical protein VLC93_09495, partial [Myxococcota bacterium]|nr:hypothetical protein [Myxococcota bacterium]